MHRAHALLVHIDAGHVEARLGEHHRQRQARVAETDDPDGGLTRGYPLVERLG